MEIWGLTQGRRGTLIRFGGTLKPPRGYWRSKLWGRVGKFNRGLLGKDGPPEKDVRKVAGNMSPRSTREECLVDSTGVRGGLGSPLSLL